eukprot:4665633-Prymnesium_polylepis.1
MEWPACNSARGARVCRAVPVAEREDAGRPDPESDFPPIPATARRHARVCVARLRLTVDPLGNNIAY